MEAIQTIDIRTKCPFCGTINSVIVPKENYKQWQNGELVQKAFPMLSADEREMLVSRMCLGCQAKVFGEECPF